MTDQVSDTTLYLFAISHYCEKARWALELLGIPYRARFVAPGANRAIARKLGAREGSVPFLQAGNQVIAGSGAIIDWGEANRKADRHSLAGDDPAAVLAIENRLDKVAGVHIRRFYYSDALFSMPGAVRPVFSRDLPMLSKIMVTVAWPMLVPVMKKGLDLGPEQGARSRDRLLGELDWLDALLSDGRRFLTGETLTRADITAASLLAPLVTPAKHPVYADVPLPPALSETIADWQNRPVLRWVRDMYDRHR